METANRDLMGGAADKDHITAPPAVGTPVQRVGLHKPWQS